MSEVTDGIEAGTVAGFLGALCCLTPTVMLLFGIATVSAATGLAAMLAGSYRWTIFVPLAILFLVAAVYAHIRKREKKCKWKHVPKYKTFIITAIIASVIIWVVLIYLLIPFIFDLYA